MIEFTYDQYVEDVLSGRQRACRWVRLACQRHVDDLENGSDRGLIFDDQVAMTAIVFFSLLKQSKGEWAGQPLILQPWQQFIVASLVGWKWKAAGMRRFRTAYLEVSRKNGKALHVDTPVPTLYGWKRHGDLRPGDIIFGETGKPIRVLANSGVYSGPCYEVRFTDGTKIIAHERHEWKTERSVHTGRNHGERRPLPLVETYEIYNTLTYGARNDLVHTIPTIDALQCPHVELPIDPYVLGAWLGDGTSECAKITCCDDEILNQIYLRGYSIEGKHYAPNLYLIGRGYLQSKLREIGVLNNKHIPAVYMRASKRQRLDLLKGLMDTDGYVSKKGQCEFVQKNGALFWQVVELVRSLGYKPTVKVDRAMLYGKDCGPRYRTQFYFYSDEPCFYLPRKIKRLKKRPKSRQRSQTRKIESVNFAGNCNVNCIQVDGGMYLAGNGMVATHNSTLAAGLGLYLLVADGEPGAEIYTAATKKDQAKIIHSEATRMAKTSPAIRKEVDLVRDNIYITDTASKYVPLGADSDTLDGLNVQGAIIDELHAHKTREVWDVLDTGTGSRRQPLIFSITTSGWNRESVCYEKHDYTQKVLQRVIEDDTWFGMIYTLDREETEDENGEPKGDDWRDEAVWVKANPNLGVSKKVDDMRRKAKYAKEVPAAQNAFLRKELDVWTQSETKWVPWEHWKQCNLAVDADGLRGREAYGGLDLSSNTDITAFVLVFPPQSPDDTYQVLPRFFIPKNSMHERTRKDKVPYEAWVRQGYIIATPGDVIDYEFILEQISQDMQTYDVKEIAFDRWGASQIQTKLMDMGGEDFLVQFGQGFASMSPPMKDLERLIIDHQISHGNNPVLNWMASNLVARSDAAENIKPDKQKSIERIDGMVALIMALDRCLRNDGPPDKSLYEDRGLMTV